MNVVLRVLVLSDLFIMGGFGLMQPIFAVYMITQISGATVASVGIAATIELFTRALLQIHISSWADKEKGNCRELYTLIVGSFFISLVPLGYYFATTLWHIYAIQLMYGLGQALSYPSWRVLFTRYTDASRAGYTWSVYDTTVSFGVAAAAAIGAFVAQEFSFRSLFLVVTGICMVGSFFLIRIFGQEFSCQVHFHKK